MSHLLRPWLAAAAIISACAVPSAAQALRDPDRAPNPAQPDFTLATLPTTLRLPARRLAFRLTHRFGRPLGQGDLGDLASDLFGLDSGAQVGLELRYGLMKGAQIGVYRTSDRTIEIFGQYDVVSQRSAPIGLDVAVRVDGTDNFSDAYSPGVSFIVSRELGGRGAVYLVPSWIGNTNPIDPAPPDDHTMLLGLGARARVLRQTYLVVEASPRLGGYAPRAAHLSFGLEQRAGGHVFQLNVSNGLGTTLAQVARGGTGYDDWYIGFNLTRKFF